jgi:hypothetical protein
VVQVALRRPDDQLQDVGDLARVLVGVCHVRILASGRRNTRRIVNPG